MSEISEQKIKRTVGPLEANPNPQEITPLHCDIHAFLLKIFKNDEHRDTNCWHCKAASLLYRIDAKEKL